MWWMKYKTKFKRLQLLNKFDRVKVLIDTDKKQSNDVPLKNVVISTTCVTNNNSGYYRQIL